MISQGKYDEAFAGIEAWENEIAEHNQEIVKRIGVSWRAISDLLDGAAISNKMEIVAKPSGSEEFEEHDLFKKIYIDQRAVGDSGDSFTGTIYAMLDDDKWLAIPFEC